MAATSASPAGQRTVQVRALVATVAAAAGLGAVGGALLTSWLLRQQQLEVHSASSPSQGAAAQQQDGKKKAAKKGKDSTAAAAPTNGDHAAAAAEGSEAEDDEPITGRGKTRAKGGRGAILEGDVTFDRKVHCEDAVGWLEKKGAVPQGAVVFTSLPDVVEVKEFAPTVEEWKTWFSKAVASVLKALPEGSVAIFYQTDIRMPGEGQISKANLVLNAANQVEGIKLWWHKIVHFGNVDSPAFAAVQFTHMLCFGKEGGNQAAAEEAKASLQDLGGAVPDVLARGPKPWGLRKSTRCMGAHCVNEVLKWVAKLDGVHTVVDPFCGAGTVLAVANSIGLKAVGVDISPRRVKQAEKLDGDALLEAAREEVAAAKGGGGGGKRGGGRGKGGKNKKGQ